MTTIATTPAYPEHPRASGHMGKIKLIERKEGQDCVKFLTVLFDNYKLAGYAYSPEMHKALTQMTHQDHKLARLFDREDSETSMWEALKPMVCDTITTVVKAEEKAFQIKANPELHSQVGIKLVNHIGECYERVHESDKQNIPLSMAGAIINAVQDYWPSVDT